MPFSRVIVKPCSPFVSARSRRCALAFVALATLVSVAVSSSARASDVALLPLGGGDRGTAVTSALREAATRAGHRPVEAERVQASLTARGGEPSAMRDLTALGAELQADYVVGGTVRARGRTGYTLSLRVVRVLSGRLEEADFDVNEATQARRLESIVRVVISDQGLESAPVGFLEDPEAVVASTTPPRSDPPPATPPTGGDDDDDLTPAEREAIQRAEEAERLRREEEERADAEAFGEDGRERTPRPSRGARTGPRPPARRYGENAAMVSFGVGPAFLVARPDPGNRPADAQTGAAMALLSLRGGFALASVRGLELRGGLDFYVGDVNAFAISAGAAYLLRPAASLPLDIGAAAEIGLFHGLTGGEPTLFQVRAEAVVTYALAREVQLELAPVSLTGLLGSPSALALGASARFAVRF